MIIGYATIQKDTLLSKTNSAKFTIACIIRGCIYVHVSIEMTVETVLQSEYIIFSLNHEYYGGLYYDNDMS